MGGVTLFFYSQQMEREKRKGRQSGPVIRLTPVKSHPAFILVLIFYFVSLSFKIEEIQGTEIKKKKSVTFSNKSPALDYL